VSDGLCDPVNGGIGGHRVLYFRGETNWRAIQSGIDMLENVLGCTGAVLYPNSRVYANTRNIVEAIQHAEIHALLAPGADWQAIPSTIKFVVVDQEAFRHGTVLSADTLRIPTYSKTNPPLHLHRVFSDCIEIESVADGDLAYRIDFGAANGIS
jgi:hypothetical protein